MIDLEQCRKIFAIQTELAEQTNQEARDDRAEQIRGMLKERFGIDAGDIPAGLRGLDVAENLTIGLEGDDILYVSWCCPKCDRDYYNRIWSADNAGNLLARIGEALQWGEKHECFVYPTDPMDKIAKQLERFADIVERHYNLE